MKIQNLLFSVAASLALGSSSVVLADEVFFDTVSTEKASRMSGAYFGAFAGWANVSDADTSGDLDGADINDGNGWIGGLEVGYYWRTPFPVRPAIELEGFYMSNELESGGDSELNADLWAAGAFVNVLLALDLSVYQEDLGPMWPALRPYIGAGVGAAYTKIDGGTYRDEAGSSRDLGSSSKVTFAYQLFAGLEVALADDLSIYGEYKYLVLNDTGRDNISEVATNLWTLGVKVQY